LYDSTHKEESKQAPKHITEVVKAIEEECFSDLNPEDIPDDCISDLGDNVNDNQTLESAAQVEQDSLTNAAAAMVQAAEEANERFMKDFVKLYAQDQNAAKALYYMQKVHFDINTPEG
jgi:hypothetical protein